MARKCDKCGEHRWSYYGYCMSLKCAGHYTHPDYPLSAPPEHKWYKTEAKEVKPRRPRKPRKGALRSTLLWYEEKGEDPPWIQSNDNRA